MINADFKNFVENNQKLVTRKESKNHPGLFVIKYTKKVFYDNLWNVSPYLLDCRGLVVDGEYNVVVRPFTKIFNYGENSAGTTWEKDCLVFVSKKVNGFMAGITNHQGKLIISTTGSLDSDFVGYAHEHLKHITEDMIKSGYTYMFEIVHEDDPHIIPESIGAHFLSIVAHDNGYTIYKFDDEVSPLMEFALNDFRKIGIHVEDEAIIWEFDKLLEHIKTVQHEGYVVVNPYFEETIKIKSPYYLFKKFLARVGTKRLIDGIRTGTIKERIDEEYYPVLDKVIKFGVEDFCELTEVNRLVLLREYIEEGFSK